MDIRELGKIQYRSHESIGTYVTSVIGVIDESIERYRAGLIDEGYTLVSERTAARNRFYVYKKGDDALFLSYFPVLSEARVIEEESSLHFSFADKCTEDTVTPSITQLDLGDFAMCYAIRMADGRFIVIDMGYYPEDVDTLYNLLTERAEGRDIRIAAWILTHPHIDHYHGVMPFLRRYSDKVTVEKMLFSFPACDPEDLVMLPDLGGPNDDMHKIPELRELMTELGIPEFRTHTGVIYNIGGAEIEILNSPDDNLYPNVRNSNNVSLVFTFTYRGQKIFFGGDYQFHTAPWRGYRFTDVWGDYIKSDIMQVPHHGFHGGTKRLIEDCNAHTYLMPSFEDDTFEKICCKYDFNYLSWVRPETLDYYTGSTGNVTINIPHVPTKEGRERLDALLEKYGVTEDKIVHRF